MIKLIEMKNNLKNKNVYHQIFNEAFPIEERWNFEMILENKSNSRYKFYSILDDDKPIGLTMIWIFEKFYFGEYLAIDKNLRGKNYGSQVLNKIFDMHDDKLIVIEVEPYDLNDIAKRRINWYKRCGFILSDYDYDMPCIKDGKRDTMKMQIMTNKEIQTKEEYNNIITTLYDKVYNPRLDNINNWKEI
ncbi:GNAT family N-acetyltransferase [Brachyspira sp. SAP_772]|uniref:GNAT family N-acetyltransferase n=1 Tax=Brachyspira sp. SAP_772 TaxID=2608385 RepID=UPI0012F47CD6|nr:GNAT family N-acetyltransferase [Brachyspira sp. SAP_772]